MKFVTQLTPPVLRPLLKRCEAEGRNRFVRHWRGRSKVVTRRPVKSFQAEQRHVFFGYFDITPFSRNDTRILAHRVWTGADPRRDGAEIGFYELEGQRFRRLGETALWCWQMGGRLRWLGESQVLCNDFFDSQTYGAVLYDGDSGTETQRFTAPFYDVSPGGGKALTLNFSRLQRLRPGYGYARLPDATSHERCPRGSGIAQCCLDSGGVDLLVSVAEIAEIDPHSSMNGAEHYLNHLSWAPSGDRFCVFHLWNGADGRRRARLLWFDRDGQVLGHIPDLDHISHFDWTSDGRAVLAFVRMPGDDQPRYQLLDLDEGTHSQILGGRLDRDGHPMFAPGSDRCFVADTYPDRNSYRHLYVCDLEAETTERLAMFHSPPGQTGEMRCDLHPRWSHDGAFVAVDSAHHDLRSIVLVDMRCHT